MADSARRDKKPVTPGQMAVVAAVLVVLIAGLTYHFFLAPKLPPPGTMDEWNQGMAKMQKAQNDVILANLRKMSSANRERARGMYPDLVKQVEQEEAAKAGKPGGTTN